MLIWEVLVVILLILINGFFAMSELAVVSSRRARLQQLADEGYKGAPIAMELLVDPSRFLSTVQVGITLIGILAGAYGGATLAEELAAYLNQYEMLAEHSEGIAFGLVVMFITYFSLIFGELVPKRFALGHAEKIAVYVARPMRLLSKVGGPLVTFLGASTEKVLGLLGIRGQRDTTVTEEEVKSMIAEGTAAGVFEPAEKEMINAVLRLADRPVRAIMTPRPDVIWLDISDPIETIHREITESGHSRFLVSQGQIDELIGIVQTKDLLDRMLKGTAMDLRSVLQKPLVVHEGVRVLRLLELFKGSSVQIATVVDEYGSIEGIVTLTDILSAIAGSVVMEPGGDVELEAVRREDGSWLMDGMLSIDEVEHRVGLRHMRGDSEYHTLAGFVLSQFGHLPGVSEHFTWQGVRFEVVDVDGQRIDKILITPVAPVNPETPS